jgi:hypothetical protein
MDESDILGSVGTTYRDSCGPGLLEGLGGRGVARCFARFRTPVSGWPANVYSDDRPHFTADGVLRMWADDGVHCCTAPVHHAKSVGMNVRAIQLVGSVPCNGYHTRSPLLTE